jgi:hypothetical protein
MRAREFLTETEEYFDLSNPAILRARYFPDMDRFYELYRLTLDIVSNNEEMRHKVDDLGWPASNNAIMFAYTDQEDKTINTVLKKRGYKQTKTTSDKSKELKSVHTTSPVAKIKKNQFGV